MTAQLLPFTPRLPDRPIIISCRSRESIGCLHLSRGKVMPIALPAQHQFRFQMIATGLRSLLP